MAITADLGGKNYTLGRGKVYFDRFTPTQVSAGIGSLTRGEGERYIGNTPEFNTTSESEDLEHFDSDSGVRTKDASVQLQLDRSGSFTCDNIDIDNVALYFLGDKSTVTQTSATAQLFEIANVKQGMFYQVGWDISKPDGVRNISNVVVKTGVAFGTTVTPSGNYQVDEVTGRILILKGAPGLADGANIQVTYDLAAGTRELVISKSTAIYGSIRFVADNPIGTNRDYYFPYVKLAPDGDYNLKGDDWQTMGFTMEILKRGSLEGVYVSTRLVTP